MIQGKVDRSAFLDACKALSEETMDAIVVAHPAAFKGVVDFGAGAVVAAKPPAKPPVARKPRAVADDVTAKVLAAVEALGEGAHAPQAIMSKAGLTRGATSAALKALVDAGKLTPTGKGRGTKYAIAGAAS